MTSDEKAWFVMLATLVALALLTDGCVPLSHEPAETPVAISCPAPFTAVLHAWESAAGEPVPVECRSLDADPVHAWCSLGRVDDVGSERHAWIHALSDCIYGEPDVGHHRGGLWLSFGPGSAEARAWDVVEGCL